jgi:tetratricopeptide (TPR) repeat protein
MQVRVLPVIVAGVAVLCFALLTGCGTPRVPGVTSCTGDGGGLCPLNEKEFDFAKALAHYSVGLSLEPGKMSGTDMARAFHEFEAAAKLDPTSVTLNEKTWITALRLQHPDKAIEPLKRECELNPGSPQVWKYLGATYQLTGRTNMAIQCYTKALDLAPTNTILYIEIAGLYFRGKNDSAAVKKLEEGLKHSENPPLTLIFAYGLCREFVDAGEFERAITCLRFIADNVPVERQQCYDLLGDMYRRLDKNKDAERYYVLATKEEPLKPEPFVKLADIYLDSDPRKALDTLLDAERRLPENTIVLLALGYVYSSQKQHDKSIEVYERIRDILEKSDRPLDQTFYLSYGAACDRAGKQEKAEKILQECVDRYPYCHEALNYLAYMWAEKGLNLDKAMEYVTSALELDAKNGAYIDTLGWIYFKQGKYSEALEQIRNASEIIKDDSTITEHLGDICSALKEKEKAVSYWKQSFLLDPTSEAVAKKLSENGINIDPLRKEAARAAKHDKKKKQD